MNMQTTPQPETEVNSEEAQLSVLIVDDSPTERLRITNMVRALGYPFEQAVDGADALTKLQHKTHRLIISDLTMPNLDGRGLCRELRCSPEYQHPYIIMLTASDDHQDLVAGMDAGADDFLTKPASKDELRVRLAAGARLIRMRDSVEAQNLSLRIAQQQNEDELALAAKLQKEYVPQDQWLSPTLQLATHFTMTRGIGGDAMGLVHPKPGQTLLYQIDVMGHGIASAMLSFALQNALQQMLNYHLSANSMPPLHQIARRLNERFPSERFSGLYFTLLLALIDEEHDKVSYCQAGHPHPCVISPDGEQIQINRGSFPVGLFDFADFETRVLPFNSGSTLMLSSDGLFDVQSPSGETLGRDAIEGVLKNAPGLDATETMAQIVKTKRQWQRHQPLADDVSVLLVKRSLCTVNKRPTPRPLFLSMQPTMESANEVLSASEAHFKTLNVAERLIGRVQTSLAELLNNYVEHANWHSDVIKPAVEIKIEVASNCLRVDITEFANPIPHLCPPKPIDLMAESGRGYHILLGWIDNIKTERKQGKNRWVLEYKSS